MEGGQDGIGSSGAGYGQPATEDSGDAGGLHQSEERDWNAEDGRDQKVKSSPGKSEKEKSAGWAPGRIILWGVWQENAQGASKI